MSKLRLSEVLEFEEILNAETNRICIVSGVGSGKNYYVENVLKNYGNILYISSRRAKVDEILVNEACSTSANWEQDSKDITVLTNAQVEYLVKNQRFDKSFSVIIEHFDFFVVDEAHSLFTDATYTNVFHVQTLIDYVADNYPNKKIILMTATPEPIPNDYLSKFKIINKTDKCINVLPSKIEFVSQEQAIKLMQRMNKNEKTVYFSNFASSLVVGKNSLFKRLTKDGVFAENEISFCMANDKAQKYQTAYAGLAKHVKEVRNFICNNSKLPDTTRILLTTATLKEGINIEYDCDEKIIKIAFCESHLLSDIQQFAGRIRDGLETLYIIDEVSQHAIDDEELRKNHLEYHCSDVALLHSINNYYSKNVKKWDSEVYTKIGYDEHLVFFHEVFYNQDYSLYSVGSKASKYFIELIEEKHAYIRYNHLKNMFELYNSRFLEQRRVNQKLRDNTWFEEIQTFAESNEIGFVTVKDKLIAFLEPLVGICFFENEEKQHIKEKLRNLLNLHTNAEITTINSSLISLGYDYQLKSNTKTIDHKTKRYLTVKRLAQAELLNTNKLLSPKELKYYIFSNKKIRYILEALGHESIKYHTKKDYFSCANIDGDNITAVNISNDKWLNVRNWTRPNAFDKNSDIITLVEYDRQCSFKQALTYLHSILGLLNIDIAKLDFSGIDDYPADVEVETGAIDMEELVPMEERILNQYVPLLYIDWLRLGIMNWTRKKFDLRFSYEEKCIVIPIRKWNDGRLVALNKRTTREDYELLGVPKYRLSKGYKKTENIYGLWENRAGIEEHRYCVIFEGEKSTLLRDSLKDPTGLSIHGKSISDKQVEIILSLNIDEVIIALDKDVHIDEVRFAAEKFYQKIKVSYIFDSFGLLASKDSPADVSNKDYRFLFDNRILYDENEHEKYIKSMSHKHE